MSRKTHFILQFCLAVIWFSILWVDNVIPVNSQTQECLQPPYMWENPLRKFWRPNFGNVVVKIDSRFDNQYSWAPDARLRIKAGQQRWNGAVCSGVTFIDFGSKTFTEQELNSPTPSGNVYWMVKDPENGTNGGIISHASTIDDRIVSATVMVKPDFPTPTSGQNYFDYLGTHEIGHSFNLNNCTAACIPVSIMGGFSFGSEDLSGPRQCDITRVNALYCPSPSPSPSPEPTPQPDNPEDCQNFGMFWNFASSGCYPEPQVCNQHCTPYWPLEAGGCESPVDYCAFQWGCAFGLTDGGQGCCCGPTPILIDVAGNGFSLTNAYDGVNFDMGGDGRREPIAWTTAATDDAWLVLDRNRNGRIDSAKEMFGNFTEQTQGSVPANGFLALAEFDKLSNGGNADGLIRKNDSVFKTLRLWQDLNKNGISEASELRSLEQLGLKTIELDYEESKRTDQHGNQFKYRAKVKDNNDAQMGRWAFDIILQVNPPR